MAFPNPIKTTGALSQYSDILEYFIGAFNYRVGTYDLSGGPESWPSYQYYDADDDEVYYQWFDGARIGTTDLALPPSGTMTRQQFYQYIDRWTITTNISYAKANDYNNAFRTIHGTKLYTFAEVQGNNNWPVEAVNHWGKIKTLELGIFGSVGNGSDLSATSIMGGTSSFLQKVQGIRICDLTYLRYAFTRFNSYGSCHPDIVEGPAVTITSQNTTARTITLGIPSGILLSDIEVRWNFNANWTTPISNPVSVPSGRKDVGAIIFRVRKNRGAYIEEGPEVSNTVVFT